MLFKKKAFKHFNHLKPMFHNMYLFHVFSQIIKLFMLILIYLKIDLIYFPLKLYEFSDENDFSINTTSLIILKRIFSLLYQKLK